MFYIGLLEFWEAIVIDMGTLVIVVANSLKIWYYIYYA